MTGINNSIDNILQVSANSFVANTTGANALSTNVGYGPFFALFAPTVTVYTSGTGTFTPPAGATRIMVEVIGAGGGGGGTDNSSQGCGGGGGGGAYVRKLITTLSPNYAYSVGSGGAGGSNTGGDGAAGGNTTFGTFFLTANGGSGGQGSTTGTGDFTGGAPGTGSGGDINISGGYGQHSFVKHIINTNTVGGVGGSSFYAPNNAPPSPGADGNNGIGFGGGGSGAIQQNSNGYTGGTGANGAIIIMIYYI